jgi:hypothetical protein
MRVQDMGLNWVEDIVSHLFKLKNYMVIENEDLPMPKTEYRRVRGHSDIDVIAIKSGELVHVECQSWWGPSKKDESKEFRRLKDRFEQAADLVFEKYNFLDTNKLQMRRNIFVTSGKPKKRARNLKGPWDRLQEFCNNNEIELVEINSIIYELIAKLKDKYPKPEKIGKEEGIARFLIHLIHNDFLNARALGV